MLGVGRVVVVQGYAFNKHLPAVAIYVVSTPPLGPAHAALMSSQPCS